MTNNQVNMRELALEILLKVLEQEEYSNVVLQQLLTTYQYLEKQDRAFLTRLCEGTIERKIELDYILNQFSKVKVKKMKPVIRNILRLGVYELKYMENIPARATCNEAVKLAQKKGFYNLKGFVNGVLRNIERKKEDIIYPDKKKQPVTYLSVCYSMPEWIVQMWKQQYGLALTETMLKAAFNEHPTTIRCNCEKTTVEQLTTSLCQENIRVEPGAYVDTALYISGYNYLKKIEAFKKGEFTIQDESSMLVALAADVKKEDFVIDVCAAPGGKSMHVAERLQGTGRVSSRDISEQKVERIRENAERLGLKNVEPKVQDALTVDDTVLGKADIVIADLPCSGLGVIGKKNDIKYKASMEGIRELVRLQRDILKIVSSYLKPGGTLIYSTCTVNQMENEENVKWIEETLGLQPESLDAYIPEKLHSETTKQGFLQLIPGVQQTDGFFLSRFKKPVS